MLLSKGRRLNVRLKIYFGCSVVSGFERDEVGGREINLEMIFVLFLVLNYCLYLFIVICCVGDVEIVILSFLVIVG